MKCKLYHGNYGHLKAWNAANCRLSKDIASASVRKHAIGFRYHCESLENVSSHFTSNIIDIGKVEHRCLFALIEKSARDVSSQAVRDCPSTRLVSPEIRE